jgi:hypothetical protein
MKRSEVKAELQRSLGSLLTNSQTGELSLQTDFGKFYCSVETYDKFEIFKRSFQTDGESLHIPFSSHEPSVQMIFSLDGYSFFNDQFDPFTIRPSSHCINYFAGYNCFNLLDEHSRQHDISFRLKKSFYADLLAQHLTSAEDGLPSMIAHEKEFNTMNQHIPADAAVVGMQLTGDQLEQRGLARAVATHEPDLVPGRNADRGLVEDRTPLDAVGEVIDVQHWCCT